MSFLSKVIQHENYRLLEQLETRRMIARKKSWNKKAVFTKTSIVPTSEIHFWIYTNAKAFDLGTYEERDTDVFMSMELPISIWKWNPVFVTKNQFYYDAHRTCVGVSQSLQPETSSACWANFTMLLFGAATTPQRLALNLVSKFPHAGSARPAIRIAPPQLRDTFIYTAHGCNKEFKMKSGGTHKITCS